MIGTDAFQEVDTYGLSVPITKHNFLVNSVAELLTVIPQAFRIAASGRPGPVLIDVPKNVQTQTLTVAAWPELGRATPRAKSGATEGLELDRRLQEAAALINGAERPVLYLGGGVIHAGAADLALSLMEKASLPTVMTLMALGAVPTDHPLSLGMLGMHGARYTNLALQECDLLIAVGARFDDRATGKVAEFCPGARVIHIDIDPSELAKLKAVEVGIVGDVGDVLKALTPRVESHLRKRWLTHLAGLKARYPLAMANR